MVIFFCKNRSVIQNKLVELMFLSTHRIPSLTRPVMLTFLVFSLVYLFKLHHALFFLLVFDFSFFKYVSFKASLIQLISSMKIGIITGIVLF